MLRASHFNDQQKAQRLLASYHGEADDFFKLWPADKHYFFASDQQAFVAYAIKYRAAICMGAPAGRQQSIERLMTEFSYFCRSNGLTAAFIQATNRYHPIYRQHDFRQILIGADGLVSLKTFNHQTVHNKYFRNIVNRFNKAGYVMIKYQPPHQPALMRELQVISDSWLKLPHRKEWSFLTGRFEEAYLQQVTVAVLRNKQGIAQAFVNETPSFRAGVANIDLMRHRLDAPSNSMDFLFIQLMQQLELAGYVSFNLGISPLDGRPSATNLTAQMLKFLYSASDSFIGFHGLHQFKSKYKPDWQPRYVWYQGSRGRLAQIGLAVWSLMTDSGKHQHLRH